jgi:hypothetical protein
MPFSRFYVKAVQTLGKMPSIVTGNLRSGKMPFRDVGKMPVPVIADFGKMPRNA